MIEPFRLYETKNPVQAEIMRKEQPWRITDEELSRFEEKVKPISDTTDTTLLYFASLLPSVCFLH